ncbi:hypothetical protein CT19431_MP130247 [Cupriavidus taiwanensis]|nr:hypothetical protein CT19431_MP130247 [Cupriavidus taiwanensis]
MIGLAGHASAARAVGMVWRVATPATEMAMERALRATRCLMLDFNYVSFFWHAWQSPGGACGRKPGRPIMRDAVCAVPRPVRLNQRCGPSNVR